ncbi:DUF7289 family protein [Halomicrobium salinisoli]|uniref:DUF7289 family protein n=1 Tax=Halomicrobium salinisoli TaxID=2878391 RepID=UPI001CEFD757|nr:hypothetical protein [Halomicrobium salinisoli]
MTDRGQSNTLGFILLFSIVLASLGVVATAGVDTLESGRDVATSQNVEQSFRELAGAATDVHRENVSSRTARMRLGNGQLEVGEDTEITVDVDSTADTEVDELSVTPITYSIDDRDVTYEGTAVVREEGGGSILVRKPDFHLDADGGLVVVPVVQTSQVGDTASVGGGQAEVRLLRGDADVTVVRPDSSTDVTLTVDPPDSRVEAWETALESASDGCSVDSDGTEAWAECPVSDDDTVIVRHVEVEFEFGG